jgi:hypothetical protein
MMYSPPAESQDEKFSLPTFTLAIAFSAKKQACGPEARALRGKSIGLVISDCGFRIVDFFGFLFQSAFRNRHSAIWRRAYRAPGRAPLQRNYPVLGKRTACPPDPEMNRALWFLRATPLLSGRATAETQ